MLLEILTLVAAQLSPDPAAVIELDGRCTYPPGLGEPLAGEVRVICNRTQVEGDGITFASRDWGPQIRFNGFLEGSRMVVESVSLRTGEPVEVRGLCRLFYANGDVSVISCTAVEEGGSRTWIANFVPWRG